MNYSIVIQHVPWVGWRGDNASRMEGKLRHHGVPVDRVNAYRDESVWDTARRSWITGWRCGKDYTFILQDDIQLAGGFPDLLGDVLDAVADEPDPPPICLFNPRKAHADKCRDGSPFVRVSQGIWGQARGLPTDRIPEFISWQEAAVHPDHDHDDTRESLFAEYQMGQSVFIPQPSLVEHIGANRSNLGQNHPNPDARKAAWFADESEDIDYSYDSREDLPRASASNLAKRYRDELNPELIPDD